MTRRPPPEGDDSLTDLQSNVRAIGSCMLALESKRLGECTGQFEPLVKSIIGKVQNIHGDIQDLKVSLSEVERKMSKLRSMIG